MSEGNNLSSLVLGHNAIGLNHALFEDFERKTPNKLFAVGACSDCDDFVLDLEVDDAPNMRSNNHNPLSRGEPPKLPLPPSAGSAEAEKATIGKFTGNTHNGLRRGFPSVSEDCRANKLVRNGHDVRELTP